MAKTKDWKWGYISPRGEFVIAPAFDGASDLHDGHSVVKIDWERKCIDRSGHFCPDSVCPAPPTLEMQVGYNPSYELHDGLVRFVENQKYGYKDKDGNVVVKPQFFEATDFSEGLACVKKGKTGLWAYIDTTGRTVIPARFRQAKPFHEGLAAVLTAIE